MIWVAAVLALFALLAAWPNVPRWMWGPLVPVWFMISLTGQLFALPLMIAGAVLAVIAEGTAAWVFAGAAAVAALAHWRNRIAGRLLLDSVGLTETTIPLLAGLTPFLTGDSQVRRIKDIPYGDVGPRNLLDIVLPKTPPTAPMPILIQVHGGAWVLGSKGLQAKPLVNHLVARGWMAVDINYRLGPADRFPAQTIDVLKAIAWVKAHAHEHGGDPTRIAITGGSAGGHLAALAALAHDDPALKPGMEEVDCSVQAAVPVYGRYDLLDRLGHMKAMHRFAVDEFLAQRVLPGRPDVCGEVWLGHSPIERLRDSAPPMLIIHGTGDSMLPFQDARDFAEGLRRVSREPVILVELPGIEHEYEMASSALTWAHVRAIEAFLAPLTQAVQAGAARPGDLPEERVFAAVG